MANLSQKTRFVQRHPRLVQLDTELQDRRLKDFDYLTAKHDGIQVTIAVMRERSYRFIASCTYKKKTYRSWAIRPSHAFAKVLEQLRWAIALHHVTENFERGVSKRLSR